MRTSSIWPALALLAISATGTIAMAQPDRLFDAPKPPNGFPKFQVQEIESGLKIGYAVILEDIDGDKKKDIVVVDQFQIVWYQNPTWKKRVILDGKTKPDNVCICAVDIDGDKLPELVVGAGWKPTDTKTPGTLQWLKRGKTIDDEWTMYPIPCDEPTVHRLAVGDLDADGKPEIVMAPLHGLGATAKANWTDGRPVRIQVYTVPAKDPEKKQSWQSRELLFTRDPKVVHSIHICTKPHIYQPYSTSPRIEYRMVYVGSNDGVWQLWEFADRKLNVQIPVVSGLKRQGKNFHQNASEVHTGYANTANPLTYFIATVEPWHGNSLVVYPEGEGQKAVVVDDHLRWGHAIQCADLTGDKTDFIVLGVRDNPMPADKFKEKRGVRLYRNTDGQGQEWDRYILEDGDVAAEALAVGDLDGDGKPDIVAVGRQTFNCRIYWNKGK